MKKVPALFVFMFFALTQNLYADFSEFITQYNSGNNNITVSDHVLTATGNIAAIAGGRNVVIASRNPLGSSFNGVGLYSLFGSDNSGYANVDFTFNNISLENAYKTGDAGGSALFLSKSAATFNGKTVISGNITNSFGAVSANSASKIIFNGDVDFLNNAATVATGLGGTGALHLQESSEAIFNGDVLFSGNSSKRFNAGAFLVFTGSKITFNKNVTVTNNTGGDFAAAGRASVGGASFATNALGDFYGTTIFSHNVSTAMVGTNSGAGGLSVSGASKVNFHGNTKIFNNSTTTGAGGGIGVFSRSSVKFFSDVLFDSNSAFGAGGAIYVANANSNIDFGASNSNNHKVSITNNTAGSYGGGMYITDSTLGGASVNFYNAVEFSGNKATATDSRGGAFAILYNKSAANFYSTADIINNSAGTLGGGFYVQQYAKVYFGGDANISGNKLTGTAASNGGGFSNYLSEVIFDAKALIQNNHTTDIAGSTGGGFYAGSTSTGTKVIFNGAAIIDSNTTRGSGAGFANSGATIKFNDTVTISNNINKGILGGAIYTISNSTNAVSVIRFDGESAFLNNSVTGGHGGAILSRGIGTLTDFNNYATFKENTASGYGGAITIAGVDASNNIIGAASVININNGASFFDNSAGIEGGAIYLYGAGINENMAVVNITNIDADRSTVFKGNTANGNSNAVYLEANSRINFDIQSGSVEMYDGIYGKANNNAINITGNGDFNFYGSAFANAADINISGGVNFNLMDNGLLEAGNLSVDTQSHINIFNGTASTVKSTDLSLLGTTTMGVYAGSNDLFSASGAGVVGGDLIIKGFGNFNNEKIGIINAAGGLGGSIFGTIAMPLGWTYTVDYFDADWVYLVITGKANSNLKDTAKTHNQQQAANAIDEISLQGDSDWDAVISAIVNLSDEEQRGALDNLAGSFIANALHSASQVYKYNRLEKYCKAGGSRLWAEVTGGQVNYDSDINSVYDFKDTKFGFTAGYDFVANENNLFGILAGYLKHELKQNRDSGEISDIAAALYGGTNGEYFDFYGVFGVAAQSFELSRKIAYDGSTAKSDFDAYDYFGGLELGYVLFKGKTVKVRPFLAGNVSVLSYDSFKEKGAGIFNLNVQDNKFVNADAEAGVSLHGSAEKLEWSFSGAFKHVLYGNMGKFDAVFDVLDKNMNIYGTKMDRNMLDVKAGIAYKITMPVKVYASIGANTNKEYNGRIGIQYAFCKYKAPEKIKAVTVEKKTAEVEEEPESTTEYSVVDYFAKEEKTESEIAMEEEIKEEFVAVAAAETSVEVAEAAEAATAELAKEHERIEKQVQTKNKKVFDASFGTVFESNSYQLSRAAKRELYAFAKELIESGQYRLVTVEGHTDSTGGRAINRPLSEKRAKAVADYLIDEGVDPKRIISRGMGGAKPIATNKTKEGRMQNRRIELLVR